MMRAQILNEIESLLDEDDRFVSGDFSITSKKTAAKDAGAKVEILYRYDDQFFFSALLPKSKEESAKGYGSAHVIKVGFCPGEINLLEEDSVENKSGLFSALKRWLSFLKGELDATPDRRELAAQRKDLEGLVATVSEMPDELFSREEAGELRKRLDDLEERLYESARRAVEDKDELEQRIASIQTDMEALRGNLETMTKRNWAKSAMVRISGWLRNPENREMLKSGTEVAKRLLSESTNASVDD